MRMSRLASTAFMLLSPAVLLGVVLSQAPGDQDQICLRQYEYPANVAVLMDSWKYNRVLLPSDGNDQSAVWDRISLNETMPGSIWKYKGSACEHSMVQVCSYVEGRQDNWLFTQYINKSVPAEDFYPVRVFVNITYSFMTCPGRGKCSPQFKLLKYVTNSQQRRATYTNTSSYSGDGIMPDNVIVKNTISNGTKLFYFIMSEEDKGFYLALRDYSEDKGACVSVSRVLVYRHECHALDKGLAHFPAFQAPAKGTVLVQSECRENAHQSNTLSCTAEGRWQYDQMVCECDFGYHMRVSVCRAYITPVQMSYMVTEEEHSVDVCFISTSQTGLTVGVETRDNTATAGFDYVGVNKTLTFGPSRRHCEKICIVNDTLQEKEESFIVNIISPGGNIISHSKVNISPSNTDHSCEDGNISLVSGVNGSSLQLVQICRAGAWFPVCDHNWTAADATVVCRELGYHHLGLTQVLESGGTPHQSQMVPECQGTEDSLTDCLEMPDIVTTCQFVLVECRNNINVVTITTSLQSPEPTISLPSVEGSDSAHVGTIAGVAGCAALIAILVLLVLLVVVILWKRKKDKGPRVGYLDNPIYSIAEGLDNQLDGQGTGNPKQEKKIVEKLQETSNSNAFQNPIYDCAESSTNREAADTDQPKYSTLENSIVPAEYEVPLILSPTADNNHHPHIYDSVPSPVQSTGAEYSVLEHTNHIYSCLEGPEVSVASSGKEAGQGQPTGIKGSQVKGECSSIEPK